jgi:nitroreductase
MPGREQTGVALGEDAPIFDVMRTMRAMRRLAPDPVPDELLERLVEAATWAPSGSNAQEYHFVVVTDRDQMARLAPLWRRCLHAYEASIATVTPSTMDQAAYDRLIATIRHQAEHFEDTPAAIVPCYSYGRVTRRVSPRAAVEGLRRLGARNGVEFALRGQRQSAVAEASSVYPGVQNMLLAARALGLAANLTTWHLFLEREVKQVLGIPRGINTYAIVPVGWPLGRFGPVSRRPGAEAIHRDRW